MRACCSSVPGPLTFKARRSVFGWGRGQAATQPHSADTSSSCCHLQTAHKATHQIAPWSPSLQGCSTAAAAPPAAAPPAPLLALLPLRCRPHPLPPVVQQWAARWGCLPQQPQPLGQHPLRPKSCWHSAPPRAAAVCRCWSPAPPAGGVQRQGAHTGERWHPPLAQLLQRVHTTAEAQRERALSLPPARQGCTTVNRPHRSESRPPPSPLTLLVLPRASASVCAARSMTQQPSTRYLKRWMPGGRPCTHGVTKGWARGTRCEGVRGTSCDRNGAGGASQQAPDVLQGPQ